MVVLMVLVLVGSRAVGAQRGLAREGALFLVLPLGARTIGAGQSVALAEPSAEQLYWNPAGIARASQREFAFNHGDFLVGPLLSVTGVVPFERAGVIGVSVAVLDYGAQETVDVNGGIVGSTSQQSYILAATYAATLGPRASLGFTYKNARFVGSCSGLCDALSKFDVSSTAIDVGLQVMPARDDDIILAAAIRHAGLRLQVNDNEQADPLPTRAQVGASYRVRAIEGELQGAVLRVNADVIDRTRAPGDLAVRFGADLSWQSLVSVRASYVDGDGEGTGVGIGFGFVAKRYAFDLARTLGGSGEAASTGSTFVSFRGRW